MEALFEGITARHEAMDVMDQEIETYRYQADNEADAKEKARKEAIWEAAMNNRMAQDTANKNNERLAKQFEVQIRAVQNQYFITYAVLLAEKTNADLMVAIKADMNAAEDITELTAEKSAAGTTAARIADIDLRLETLNGFRAR
jgi:hypothetical protein